ncbi:hypothetical protein ACLNBZ_10280, partial [Streptococcus pneumoniae]|uniref:mannitol dehydrogenase family protein n=1 Tax=Streptococcus pneumoniae TaxID=1313 RepID=UPI00398F283B
LGTVRDRLTADLPITGLALAVAGWLHFLRGVDQAGRRYPIDDPLAGELAARLDLAEQAAREAGPGLAGASAWTARMTSLAAVFGDLGEDARFV